MTDRERMVQMLTASENEFICMFDIKINEIDEVDEPVQEIYWNWKRLIGGIGFSIGILFCVFFLWLIMTAFL